MEEKNFELLAQEVEKLKKELLELKRKLEGQEREEKAYQSEEYLQKLELFMKDKLGMSRFHHGLRYFWLPITNEKKERAILIRRPGWGFFQWFKTEVIKLPEPDQK